MQSHADAGFSYFPQEGPMKNVNNFKARMHGPLAHDERVAGLRMTRENAMKSHNITKNDLMTALHSS